MRTIAFAFALATVGVASAQVQEHQATAGHKSTDAPGLLWVSGFNDDDTAQQLILDASLLTPMVGKTISAIVFRRDVQDAQPLQGGVVSFELHISSCLTTVAAPSDQFALNRGANRSKVFSGALQLPSSPAYAGGNVWAPSNIVRVPFSSGFVYSGGNICLEFSGAGANGHSPDNWVVDAVFSQDAGTVVSVGNSAATVVPVIGPGGLKETSGANEHDLVAGGTAVFYAQGSANANALFMIGVKFLPQPLNLALVNSPQSNVLIEPVSTMLTKFGPLASPTSAAFGGEAVVELLLPADRSFLGAVLAAQWIEYDLSVPSFLTSNAVRAQVASTQPTVMMSVVTGLKSAQGVSSGKVDIGIGHVVKFEYQ